MSIQLNDLLYFPSIFKGRDRSWKVLKPKVTSIKIIDDYIEIIGNCNNHTQTIFLFNDVIDFSKSIRISCTCESFKYEFARELYLNDSLILDYPDLDNKLIQAPKEKNIHKKVTGCKHIIALVNYIKSYRHSLNSKIS